jgi:hypothetical protein
MSTHGFFTSEGLQRMQKILDETCDDLGIARDSDYAASSREFLAKQLFRIQPLSDVNDVSDARRKLASFGHRYGLRASRRTQAVR